MTPTWNYCRRCGEALGLDGQCQACGPEGEEQEQRPLAATRPLDPAQHPDPMAPAPRDPDGDPLIGAIVADRFVIQALIGKGGIGRVYRGMQLDLERAVAIKVLDDDPGLDDEARERFRREARAAGGVNHPGVAAVYDFGDWEGRPYIAMELIRGQTLYQLFAAEYPLDHARVVEILAGICDVLELTHSQHIVHRDLKPENVMLLRQERAGEQVEVVKILDFGLAMLVGPRSEQRLTQEGIVSGTPYYMSPEQCRGEAVGPASDIYAMGVLLYEQLCGRLPFLGESPTDVLLMHLFNDPDPPSKANPRAEVPAPLEQLCMRCLAKEPEDRPAGAAELARLLREARDRGFVAAPERRRRATMRKRMVEVLDRAARAEALSIPEQVSRETEAPSPESCSVLVVESPRSFASSLTRLLRGKAFNAAGPNSLARAVKRLPRFAPDLVVVDLEPGPEQILAALEQRLSGGKLEGVPVVVVGPTDSVAHMARSLQLNIGDYLPREELAERLPRSLRRIHRRKRAG